MPRISILLLAMLAFAVVSCGEESGDKTNSTDSKTFSAAPDGLFQVVDAADSGIEFVNTVTSDFSFNYINYGYLYNGAGVGVLDFDQDGLQDLFFVSNQQENRLYRNLGNWEFEDVTVTAGVAGSPGFDVGVSVADVNGDGYPDLYVSRAGIDNTPEGKKARENQLFINSTDGTFTEEAEAYGLNSNRPATQATFFDYDGDGDLDMYQMNTPIDFANVNTVRATQGPNGLKRKEGPQEEWESDQLFRNDDGKFVDVSEQAGIVNRGYGLSLLIYDFNHDGHIDIYVANDYIDSDLVYINSGNGTFTDQASSYLRHSSLNSMGSDLGDLNNDGLEDIISLDMLAEKYQRQKQLESNMRPDRYNTLIRMGYGHQLMRNQLQLNNGQNFSEIGELAGIDATDWSWTPLLVDFDNDRNLDLFISNGYRYDVTDVDFIAYTTEEIMAKGGLSQKMFPKFQDFLDLVPARPQPNYLYRNKGNLEFENVASKWNVDEPAYSGSSVYADLDNDGDMDLVVTNHERPPFVYKNTTQEKGLGRNWLQLSTKGYAKNTAGIGLTAKAYVGNEKLMQTMLPTKGFLGTNEALLHFGLGDANKVDRLEITWPDGRTQLLTDVKVNQRLELKYGQANGRPFAQSLGADAGARFTYTGKQRGVDFVHQENPFDDFDRQFLQLRMTSKEGPALAVGDVNGDGLEDIFFGGAAGSAGALYLQNAQGEFARTSNFPAGQDAYEDVSAEFFDADGDGDLDLYIASGGSAAPANHASYQDRLFLNDNGKLTLAPANLPEMLTPTGAVKPMDYDADGDLDLVVGGRVIPGSYPYAPSSYLLRNDGGAFTDVTESVFPALQKIGMVTAIAVGNLSGDDQPEIVLAGEWMPLQTFTLSDARFVVAADGPQAGAGFWQSLLIDDLDGDGQNELVAGNEGFNTRFQPTADKKAILYADDFDSNGAVDPIMTLEDEYGKMVPIATKAMMIKQLPVLKKKYVHASEYSLASIDDLFAKSQIDASKKLPLETVASTVFTNKGGSWSASALPRMAQIAPTRAIQSADFNGDGKKDLLMVGNDYGMQVETGRIDAGNGTLLLNDGKGGWTMSPNIIHGFWASLDARNLLSVKLADGKTGWVIVNNNGPAALYLQE
ncbi:MAG: hypothetical protein ACJAZ9_000501 [Neolewinella sp.]|jgi:hypothetical protein